MTTGNDILDKIGIDDGCLERVLRYEGASGINVERLNMTTLDKTLQKEANYLSILFGKYSNVSIPRSELDFGAMEIVGKRDMQDKRYEFGSRGLSIENIFIEHLEPGTFAQHLRIEIHPLFKASGEYNLNQIVSVSYEKGDEPVKVVLEGQIKDKEYPLNQKEDEKNLGAIVKAVHAAYKRAVDSQKRPKEIIFPRGMKW
ncbi:MAG: hypothetical protein NTV63_00410 [Candidatus Woesearchaeota archaeon]|nr:hypothetical protein [Candidatus Woesearchaeota archaeon]